MSSLAIEIGIERVVYKDRITVVDTVTDGRLLNLTFISGLNNGYVETRHRIFFF